MWNFKSEGNCKLDEISSRALKKAVQTAEEKEIIENKTGSGLSGSYILTKKVTKIEKPPTVSETVLENKPERV